MSMEQLTDKRMKGDGFVIVDPAEYKAFVKNEKPNGKQIYKRLLEIENILGNTYDLDRLQELVEADRDGRCVVLPDKKHTNEDGENALKSAMSTCYYNNNPVTRYIADAVAEKLTREAALAKEADHE